MGRILTDACTFVCAGTGRETESGREGWDVTVCGWEGQGNGVGGWIGPDADVSAVTLVATEQQQGLPFPFLSLASHSDHKPCGLGNNQ